MNILNRHCAGSVQPEPELNCKKSYFFANTSIAIEPLLFSAPLASWW